MRGQSQSFALTRLKVILEFFPYALKPRTTPNFPQQSFSFHFLKGFLKAKPGVQIVFNPRIDDGISTSQIIEKIRKKSLQLKKCIECSICLS
jgi:hypothetical protein